MPTYKVRGAKVVTYKKVITLTCDTEQEAREQAEEKLAEFGTARGEGSIHTQVYYIQQIIEE